MKYLVGCPERHLSHGLNQRYRADIGSERASSFRGIAVLYHHLDREKVGDHVTAVVPIMLVWLDGPIGGFGTGQQGVSAGLFGRRPIKFPTSPRIAACRIEKMRLGPGLATIGAYSDLGCIALACPCSAKDRVHPIRREGFVNTWPGDRGFQLHFR